MDMKQFRSHVPSIDNFGFAGFGKDGFFCYVKFLCNEVKHMAGEFSYFRHSVECVKIDLWREQNDTPRV